MNKRPLLVLIDGSAVFHRGFHAIPHLTNKAGEPTNAVYGFAIILFKVLTELKPDYAVVAWDKSSKTFRKEIFPEYKATRSKQPDELYAQIPATRELVAALNLPFIEVEGYEADDIIGTLARKAEEQGLSTVIATGDRDQLQLIDENTVVDMFNPRGTEPTRYDLAKMQEKYGLTPQQFIDYKAIVGDNSDNIPGVAGIGDVGARKLLAEYKTLEGIYEHLDQIKGATHDKLEKSRDMAFLSRKLSEIVCDMPIDLELEGSQVGRFDREQLAELFRRLEFRSLLAKLPPELAPAAASAPVSSGNPTLFGDTEPAAAGPAREHLKSADYSLVQSEEELERLADELAAKKRFAVDTETTSVNVLEADLVGLSFSWEEGTGFYIPVGHSDGEQLPREKVLERLRPIFEDRDVTKIGHNIKYDYEVLKRHGVTLKGELFDTMVAAFLLNVGGRGLSLDALAFSELGIEMIPISELIGKGKGQKSFAEVPIGTAATYAAEDADVTWRLSELLWKRLEDEGLFELGRRTEWPLIPVLGDMELEGIALDVPFLRALSEKLGRRIGEIKEEIYKLAGEEFNLGSPAQLSAILFQRLNLPTAGIKRGKSAYSTAADELEKLRGTHPIIPLISEFRELDKLKNTYLDALPELVAADGRVHTSFNQTIVSTGRLSSSNPNLQNIPVRTELGREIRKAFVAPPGRVLVGADYSQIELRVAAALAGDEDMIETFRQGIDLHARTAADLYGVPLEEVTKEQRGAAKTINFGVLYGMSAHGLSVGTGMSQAEAQEFIRRYFEVRPKLAKYIEDTKKFAHEHLYTQTLLGRRRPCPDVRSSQFAIRNGAERVAVNVPIQGTAADIYKLAMIALAERLDDNSKLLLQIHDELIVETDASRGEEIAELMRETMTGAYDLGVPLAVDTAIGTDWGKL